MENHFESYSVMHIHAHLKELADASMVFQRWKGRHEIYLGPS